MGLLLGPVHANIFMIELETIIDTFVKKILRLSSNMIGNSNDETIFPLKLLLPDRQVARLPKAFANNSPANKDLSKTQDIQNKYNYIDLFKKIQLQVTTW